MVKPPTLIARVFRAGAALAATAAISSILTPTAGRAEGSNPLDAASINGSGFYRFKIGSFQAAVISDGFGEIPVGRLFAPNASEAELAATLKANFMPPTYRGPATSSSSIRGTNGFLSIPDLAKNSVRLSTISRGSCQTCNVRVSRSTASIWSSSRMDISITSAV